MEIKTDRIMMYVYLNQNFTFQEQKEILEEFVNSRGIIVDKLFYDFDEMLSHIKKSDTVLISEYYQIGAKSKTVFYNLSKILKKNAKVQVICSDIIIEKPVMKYFELLLEMESVVKNPSKDNSLPTPKKEDLKNKQYFHDNIAIHHKKIISYLENKISIASIARTIGVHRNTLTSYIQRNILK